MKLESPEQTTANACQMRVPDQELITISYGFTGIALCLGVVASWVVAAAFLQNMVDPPTDMPQAAGRYGLTMITVLALAAFGGLSHFVAGCTFLVWMDTVN